MLKVVNIIPGSPADSGEIQPGDKLLQINGVDTADLIDYKYAEADVILKLKLLRNDQMVTASIEKDIDQTLGLEFKPDRIIRCNNKCIFCFCHNNPKHLRRSLYIKDDDYRYSFLQGSFITLTNLSEEDIQRIIKLHLSPMYVSVQATDCDIRRKLFGKKNVAPVMPVLRRFAENKISFHCQVVIVPGYNDREILQKTAADLAALKPYATSLAIVPVGLTDYSDPELKPVDSKKALELIDIVKRLRRRYGDRENHFAYAADELFIKASLDIPKASYYDDFPQIENGVGMVRDFLDTVPKNMPQKIPGYWITGKSMIDIWRKNIAVQSNTSIKLIPVMNRLFGSRVTVTGLLSGRDILATLEKRKLKDEPIILPPNNLNHDGLFIDDLTIGNLEEKLGRKVIQGGYSLKDTLEMVA